ncbi:hypothetical protein U1Q18_036200, partial [Sarracenia purpurea var. burkii]
KRARHVCDFGGGKLPLFLLSMDLDIAGCLLLGLFARLLFILLGCFSLLWLCRSFSWLALSCCWILASAAGLLRLRMVAAILRLLSRLPSCVAFVASIRSCPKPWWLVGVAIFAKLLILLKSCCYPLAAAAAVCGLYCSVVD